MKATVIDAGVGNLGNLGRALARVGADVQVAAEPGEIARARCLVLPGVGAFRPPREKLRGELEAALAEALDRGAWLLGICVGYQLLFEGSEEFGDTDGLGLLQGRVTRLPATVSLPHIGWNALAVQPGDGYGGRLLEGIADGSHVYFVHTFAPEGVPERDVVATALHGRSFPAVVGRGRVLGTQFHPEKSGEVGLKLLANYLAMTHREAAHDEEAAHG